jgi:MFS transporter, DHA1 family, multidrug resistance protein
MEWIRDAPVGQLIRYITKNKVLKYPEERDDFGCPAHYTKGAYTPSSIDETPAGEKPEIPSSEPTEPIEETITQDDLEKIPTVPAEETRFEGIHTHATRRSQIERVGTRTALQRSLTQKDLESQYSQALENKGPSRPIVPDRLEDGTILVDWYTTDDPANPQNWALKKKLLVTLQIWLVLYKTLLRHSTNGL